MKKIMALAMLGVMSLSAVACGNSGNKGGGDSAAKKAVIGVAFYQDAGKAPTATKAYLESLSDDLNVEFKYTVFSQTDEAANVSKVQEMISSGVDGIIGTMDLGTASIMEECKAAGVYYAGYLCDFDNSFKNDYDKVFKSDNFVGAVADGNLPDTVVDGTIFFDSLVEYNEAHKDAPITHVSMAIFPPFAFPNQTIAAQQFVDAVEEHNKTADVKITVDPLNEETDVLQFAPLDSTYFAKHPDTQAIMSFAAGTSFVYPTMVSAGMDKKIKLFTSGYEGGEEENFGSKGVQTYQQNMVTAVETVTYPLVMLLNKINGVSYSDQPAEAERIATDKIIVNSDADMEAFLQNSYVTGKAADAKWTGKDVLAMTAFGNEKATYADLVKNTQSLTIDNMK